MNQSFDELRNKTEEVEDDHLVVPNLTPAADVIKQWDELGDRGKLLLIHSALLH